VEHVASKTFNRTTRLVSTLHTFKFDVFHLEVFVEYNGQIVSVKHDSNKYKTYNVIAGLHVSTLTESSSCPRDTDPYQESTMHCGIPNANKTVVNDNESD